MITWYLLFCISCSNKGLYLLDPHFLYTGPLKQIKTHIIIESLKSRSKARIQAWAWASLLRSSQNPTRTATSVGALDELTDAVPAWIYISSLFDQSTSRSSLSLVRCARPWYSSHVGNYQMALERYACKCFRLTTHHDVAKYLVSWYSQAFNADSFFLHDYYPSMTLGEPCS
jgi:hypothetical protein